MGWRLTVDPNRITEEGKAQAEALAAKFGLNLERCIYAIAERELLQRLSVVEKAQKGAQDGSEHNV